MLRRTQNQCGHILLQVTPRTAFPRVGQVFLSDRTVYPRKYRLVGQNFLVNVYPGHIFLRTDFPMTLAGFHMLGK